MMDTTGGILNYLGLKEPALMRTLDQEVMRLLDRRNLMYNTSDCCRRHQLSFT